MTCPHSDRVVAQWVDGWVHDALGADDSTRAADPDIASEPPDANGAWLAAHARECTVCQRALDRSRRLDAAIATASTHDGDRAAGDRALLGAFDRIRVERVLEEQNRLAREGAADDREARTAAVGRPRAGNDASSDRANLRSRWAIALGAAACVALGFGLAWGGAWSGVARPDADTAAVTDAAAGEPGNAVLSGFDSAAQGSDRAQPDAAPGGAGAVAATPQVGLFAIPGGTRLQLGSPRGRRSRSLLTSDLSLRSTDDVDHALAVLRSPALRARLDASRHRARFLIGGPFTAPAADLDRLEAEARDRIAAALAQSSRREAHRGWIDALPSFEAEARERALASARTSDHLRRSLVTLVRQGDADGLRGAAWLGGSELDEALRRQLRREPDRTAQVIRELALPISRPLRTALAIDLWRESIVRRALDSSVPTARQLFADFGDEVSAELLAVAQRDHNFERRELAILALAGRADAATRDDLWQLMHGEHRGIALLAALALGQLSAEDLALYERRARDPRRSLLRAVLASARSPATVRWLDSMQLTEEERAFLALGGFDREQFAIATALFRERVVTNH